VCIPGGDSVPRRGRVLWVLIGSCGPMDRDMVLDDEFADRLVGVIHTRRCITKPAERRNAPRISVVKAPVKARRDQALAAEGGCRCRGAGIAG
jgi:hypothetical protein